MSSSLYFKPVRPINEMYLSITPCQIRRDMNSLFGDYPIVLTKNSIAELETLRTLWYDSDRDFNDEMWDKDPYGIIIDMIERVGNIELYEQ